jgi:hypothetical protein
MAEQKQPAVVKPELVEDPFDGFLNDDLQQSLDASQERLVRGGPIGSPELDALKTAQRRQRQRAFLRVFAECGVVTVAARNVNVSPYTINNWIDQEPAFAQAMQMARDASTDLLEAECRRRGKDGMEEDVYYQGEVVGKQRKYSDLCLLAMLNAYRPEKFKQRHEHTGKDGGPIAVVHVTYDANMKPDDM